MSDAASVRSGTPPRRYTTSPYNNTLGNLATDFEISSDHDLSAIDTASTDHPYVIQEVSEPVSPSKPSSRKSPSTSVLTELLRNVNRAEEQNTDEEEHNSTYSDADVHIVTVRNGIISQPHESSSLLKVRVCLDSHGSRSYRLHRDIESLEGVRPGLMSPYCGSIMQPNEYVVTFGRRLLSPKTWGLKAIWRTGVINPAGYIPAVILGLLLNVLDALSYGTAVYFSDDRYLLTVTRNRYDLVSSGPASICQPRP